MNGTLSFYECRFSGGIPWVGGDIQTLPDAKEFVWSFWTDSGNAKSLGMHAHAISQALARVLAPEPPGGISTT